MNINQGVIRWEDEVGAGGGREQEYSVKQSVFEEKGWILKSGSHRFHTNSGEGNVNPVTSGELLYLSESQSPYL